MDNIFCTFRLYGDEALDSVLNTFVKLLLSIPQESYKLQFASEVYTKTLSIKTFTQ